MLTLWQLTHTTCQVPLGSISSHRILSLWNRNRLLFGSHHTHSLGFFSSTCHCAESVLSPCRTILANHLCKGHVGSCLQTSLANSTVCNWNLSWASIYNCSSSALCLCNPHHFVSATARPCLSRRTCSRLIVALACHQPPGRSNWQSFARRS